MRRRGVLSDFTFRFIALYVASLSVAVFLTQGAIYGYFSSNHFSEVRAEMENELNGLESAFAASGRSGLAEYIDERTRLGYFNPFFYLAVEKDYQKIAGNLDTWPSHMEFPGWWINFELDMREWGDQGSETEFVALSRELDNGVQVIAARHSEEVWNSSRLVLQTLIRTMLTTLLFGLVGGLVVTLITSKWITSLNLSVEEITGGNLSERIDPSDSRGSMRDLILGINQMLDTIESLMLGVKRVSDNIAHDLRTPLTRMRHQLEQMQLDSDRERPEVVTELIAECDDLLSTFAALLRIAQLEAGNRRLDFTPVTLSELCSDVVELYQPLAEEKHIVLSYQPGFDSVVRADRDLLFQVLANLVDNAIKYTSEGGRVDVRLGRGTVVVADSGPGIPEPDREKAFQRFLRLESSRSMQPGNGLGLSLVKAVVDAHGGEVELMDNDPGLRVVITFPPAARLASHLG